MTALLLFGGRLEDQRDSVELGRLWNELFTIATTEEAFGCIGHQGYGGTDGATFGVYTFRDLDGLQAFKADPRHLAVQRRAAEFFTELSIQVATVEYEYVVDLTSAGDSARD